jgi:RNA polymerase sigma-70 factor (ECF subfamily)
MLIENEDDRNKAAELYRLYSRTMLYIARGILKDQSLSEDAVSEAFVRIIGNLHKINMDDCYRTKGFVVVIVRNVSLNILKKQTREKAVPLEEYIEYSNGDVPVLDNITSKEACAEIARAIASLNKAYADILYLKYEMDYSSDEMAEVLGISRENARMRLSRARKALADRLGKEKEEALRD